MAPDLTTCFEDVLANYATTMQVHSVPRKNLPVCQSLLQLAAMLQETCYSKGLMTLKVKPSWGLGRWNPTPWVAFLDARITRTTRQAFYPVFLFRADGSGVYLTLDLGTGRVKGRPTNREMDSLQTRAAKLAKYFAALQPSGFSSDPRVDLRRDQGVSTGFAAASIIHKFYPRGAVPSPATLIADVQAVIKDYEKFCSTPELMEVFSLIQKGEVDPLLANASDIARPRGKRQGFQGDSKLRQLIEQYAMHRAIEYFQHRGYHVKDVHLSEPYDLHCVLEQETLMVEVKGTTSDGSAVLLTRGEVEHARKHDSEATLFICSGIGLELAGDGKLEARGGKIAVLRPWPLGDSFLTPVGYFYQVPGNHAS